MEKFISGIFEKLMDFSELFYIIPVKSGKNQNCLEDPRPDLVCCLFDIKIKSISNKERERERRLPTDARERQRRPPKEAHSYLHHRFYWERLHKE